MAQYSIHYLYNNKKIWGSKTANKNFTSLFLEVEVILINFDIQKLHWDNRCENFGLIAVRIFNRKSNSAK